ncbi:MAG: hypothetical protein Ct9H300mP8_08160 [Gammaproteobacteria bacterium]|nr:MAG: hypothetical protein Ct9H300mP8_08160 [Gammaproteobacteria bacterium]
MSRKLEMIGPVLRYERNVIAGYVDDLEQRKIVEIFADLHQEVLRRHSSTSLLSRIKQGLSSGSRDPIKGLYLWVGLAVVRHIDGSISRIAATWLIHENAFPPLHAPSP